ncbi:OsmC family protein [Mucilaginibacter ginsenosidivorans]|uniref:OsmC family protein n=1 Tax=Mucilaginibacter ginsenosidivorans TaxID=398053 RepID=A0A5B8UV72_9SPHI|nr:OsmC family protein [Mucilaginibacter ginsenosidivorans]QEC62822.1 OsmC family protein [Mucilaginibacter ginsenosidivorans]
MKISASIKSALNRHEVSVQTNDSAKEMNIAVKPTGFGSSVNGGELLMLSLATCFCNDIYREAAKKNIEVTGVEVEFVSEFGAEGEPGSDFRYKAHVKANATDAEIADLIAHTDRMAEIHNTLRKGLAVTLSK